MMRAGRLISLVLLLEQRGRMTAQALAAELDVSVRTVLRDIESLNEAGVRVLGSRGAGGGFQLRDAGVAASVGPGIALGTARGLPRRAQVKITPDGRRMAALLGQPVLTLRRPHQPDDEGYLRATFRFGTVQGTLPMVLALGSDVCVLEPPDLRDAVAEQLAGAAALYR